MLIDSIQVIQSGGSSTAGLPREKVLTQPGELATFTGQVRWYPTNTISVVEVQANVGTAPSGAAIICQLKKNGVALGSTVTIASDAFRSSLIVLDEEVLETDYLTVDVTQVGSSFAGSDLTFNVTYHAEL